MQVDQLVMVDQQSHLTRFNIVRQKKEVKEEGNGNMWELYLNHCHSQPPHHHHPPLTHLHSLTHSLISLQAHSMMYVSAARIQSGSVSQMCLLMYCNVMWAYCSKLKHSGVLYCMFILLKLTWDVVGCVLMYGWGVPFSPFSSLISWCAIHIMFMLVY